VSKALSSVGSRVRLCGLRSTFATYSCFDLEQVTHPSGPKCPQVENEDNNGIHSIGLFQVINGLLCTELGALKHSRHFMSFCHLVSRSRPLLYALIIL
jgi:hypothetical protein